MKDYKALANELQHELLTVQQAAAYLNKSEAAIRCLLSEGELFGVKIGYARLISKAELDQYENRR